MTPWRLASNGGARQAAISSNVAVVHAADAATSAAMAVATAAGGTAIGAGAGTAISAICSRSVRRRVSTVMYWSYRCNNE